MADRRLCANVQIYVLLGGTPRSIMRPLDEGSFGGSNQTGNIQERRTAQPHNSNEVIDVSDSQ